MIFRTYTKQGQILLDSQTPVFALTKTAHLTRLLETPFDQNKRAFWYRAKRSVVNSKMRQGWAEIYTPEYCMYYADVPSVISPITTISYDGNADGCEPIVFLNAGQFDGKTRLMFYSNGRLSDEQLANYRIHVFDTNVKRQTQVGINLYDKQGNVTFSNQSRLLQLDIRTVDITALSKQELNDFFKMSEAFDENTKTFSYNEHMDARFYNYEYFLSLDSRYAHLVSKSMKEKLDTDFSKNGFIKMGQGYLEPDIIGSPSFGVDDLTIVENAVISDHTELPDDGGNNTTTVTLKTIKMASVGCRDGLFICPTVDFGDLSTDGTKQPVNIPSGVIKNKAIHIRYSRI